MDSDCMVGFGVGFDLKLSEILLTEFLPKHVRKLHGFQDLETA